MRDYSNYRKVDTKAKIQHDAFVLLERDLKGYASFDIRVNDSFDTQVMIYQKWDADGEAKKIIGRIHEIERGHLLTHDNETWLIVTKPEDNGIYRKAEINLCHTFFPIKEDDVIISKGEDKLGRPVEDVKKGKVIQIPCIAKMNDASTAIAETNKPINNLGNIVVITIPYMESSSIDYDEEFDLYGVTYRIIRIDPSKSINGVGILKITGEMKWRDKIESET